MSKKSDVAKDIVAQVGISVLSQKATMVSDGLTRASKESLGDLLEAILEMKLQHKAEMKAAVEDSKIS